MVIPCFPFFGDVTEEFAASLNTKLREVFFQVWDWTLGWPTNVVLLARNSEALFREARQLNASGKDVRRNVENEAALRPRMERSCNVEDWLADVTSLDARVRAFRDSYDGQSSSTWVTRLGLGHAAAKLLTQVRDLKTQGDSFTAPTTSLVREAPPDADVLSREMEELKAARDDLLRKVEFQESGDPRMRRTGQVKLWLERAAAVLLAPTDASESNFVNLLSQVRDLKTQGDSFTAPSTSLVREAPPDADVLSREMEELKAARDDLLRKVEFQESGDPRMRRTGQVKLWLERAAAVLQSPTDASESDFVNLLSQVRDLKTQGDSFTAPSTSLVREAPPDADVLSREMEELKAARDDLLRKVEFQESGDPRMRRTGQVKLWLERAAAVLQSPTDASESDFVNLLSQVRDLKTQGDSFTAPSTSLVREAPPDADVLSREMEELKAARDDLLRKVEVQEGGDPRMRRTSQVKLWLERAAAVLQAPTVASKPDFLNLLSQVRDVKQQRESITGELVTMAVPEAAQPSSSNSGVDRCKRSEPGVDTVEEGITFGEDGDDRSSNPLYQAGNVSGRRIRLPSRMFVVPQIDM